MSKVNILAESDDDSVLSHFLGLVGELTRNTSIKISMEKVEEWIPTPEENAELTEMVKQERNEEHRQEYEGGDND